MEDRIRKVGREEMGNKGQKKPWWYIPFHEVVLLVSIITGLVSFLSYTLEKRNSMVRVTPRYMLDLNNLKQIGLAIHSYEVSHLELPQNIVDSEGKPLLSWRVHLLPYLEAEELYNQFDLTQPWDSEHNIKLIHQMPLVFGSPGLRDENFGEVSTTCFQLSVGKSDSESTRTIYAADGACQLKEIVDGMDNTIMVVETSVDQVVVWTKPEDHSFDPVHPTAGLGEVKKQAALVLTADGSVRILQLDMEEEAMAGLFTIDGGEEVPERW